MPIDYRNRSRGGYSISPNIQRAQVNGASVTSPKESVDRRGLLRRLYKRAHMKNGTRPRRASVCIFLQKMAGAISASYFITSWG